MAFWLALLLSEYSGSTHIVELALTRCNLLRFKDMNRLITAHPDLTRPVVDKVFPFDKTVDAYAYLESQKHVGKVVIKVA